MFGVAPLPEPEPELGGSRTKHTLSIYAPASYFVHFCKAQDCQVAIFFVGYVSIYAVVSYFVYVSPHITSLPRGNVWISRSAFV
jgi:hypothetical protein